MCNFVVPIRTCSKCHLREPLFHNTSLRDNEKAGSDEVGLPLRPSRAFLAWHPRN